MAAPLRPCAAPPGSSRPSTRSRPCSWRWASRGGRLLKYFEPDEIKRITRSASKLGAVSPDQLDVVVESFAEEFSHGSSLVGTVQEVEKLLTGLLPADQVADILAEVRGNANRSVWERLATCRRAFWELPRQGAPADRRPDPVAGQARHRRQGDGAPAAALAQHRDAADAEPEAGWSTR